MAETTPDHKFTFTHAQRTSLYSLSATTPRKRMGGWVLKLMAGLIITLLSLLSIQAISKPALAGKLTTPVPNQPTPLKKTVLVMLPNQIDLPVNEVSVQTIRKEFGNAADLKLDVYYEYMDLNRFPDSAYQQKMFELYTAKYKSKPVDLVIIVTERMLNLWLAHRAEILPDAPIVFFDITPEHLKVLKLPSDIIGVSGVVDYTKSVQWVLDKLPTVNEIVIVHGVGQADQEYNQYVQALQEKMNGQVKFTNLSNLPLSEIKQRVAVLPNSSVVVYALMFEDAAGVKYLPINALRELTAASSVPVISGYDALLGTGSIGGYMYSYEHQARDAAQISLRILRGEAASAIPSVNNQSNQFIFDHLALQKFGIPLSALPPDSLIENRQYTVWELYQAEIISVAAGFVVLLLGVAFLLILTQRLNTSRLALTKLNAVLETRVQERTFTLSQTNHDLELEITERKRIEDALVKTNLELELAFSERDNLVKDLSENQFELESHNIKLRRTQAELESVRDRYVDLYDLAPVGYCTVNENGLIREINLTAVTLLGFSRSLLINRPFTWFIFQKHRDNFYLAKEKLIATQTPQGSDLQMVKNDGSLFWAHLQITLEQLFDSSPVIRVVISDITERKRMEEALRESETFLSNVIDNSGVSIFAKDHLGKYELVNGKWEEDTGFKREFAIGKTDQDLFPGSLGERFRESDLRVIEQGIAVETEEKLENANGARFFVTIKLPLRDKNNLVTGICGISTDITELKQAAEQLREAHDRLEQRVFERTTELRDANLSLEKAARLKDEFMASMSHELRTPLTGILGLSEAMQMPGYGPLTDKQKTALGHISASGHRLFDLINDILDLSKIQAGTLEISPTYYSLAQICRAGLQMVSAQAAAKHQQHSFTISPDPIILNVDASRLKQVLISLLSNAVKFTPENGSFGIEVLAFPVEENVQITVWDNGIGIKNNDIPRLFQPFTQLDASLARQYAGTGLGLVLAQRLVELHAGSLSATSIFGSGSRFTIRLPWRPS